VNKRTRKLCKSLADNGIDAVFIVQPENRYYLSGFSGSAGYLLISNKKAILATDFRYVEQARAQAPDYEILRIANDIGDWFPGLLKDMGVKKLGFEAESITFAMYRKLKNALLPGHLSDMAFIWKPVIKPGLRSGDRTVQLNLKKSNGTNIKPGSIELIPINGIVEKLREIKEPEEIRLISKAAEISDIAYEKVVATIKVGMTEKQVAWEMEKALRENGSEAIPFDIIVASGPNAALPHAQPTERSIQNGDPIVIDMGARYGGYVSDLSRTLCIGTPDNTFRKVYNTVLDAQQAAMSIIKEGTYGHEADSIARKVVAKAGYGEAFGHALGHGVGLAAHESPRLGQGASEKLTAGMVFTVEPGIYLTGWGGVRIEDTVILVDGKAETITKAEKVRYD
jgi:Xaa-Pro aminopeptidase